MQRLAVQPQRDQRERIADVRRSHGGRPVPAAGLERLHLDRGAVRVGADERGEVAQPDPGPGAGGAPPLDAG